MNHECLKPNPLLDIYSLCNVSKRKVILSKGNCKYGCERSVNDHKGQTYISQQVHAKMYKDSFPYEMLLEILQLCLVTRYFKGIWMNLYLYLQLQRVQIRMWALPLDHRIQTVWGLMSFFSFNIKPHFLWGGGWKENREGISFFQKYVMDGLHRGVIGPP